MSFEVQCPKCASELDVPDSAAGKKVKCPDCGTQFTAAADSTAEAPAERAIQPKRPPRPSGRPARAEETEDEDGPEEEERPRRRRTRDEDEDDRPRRRRQSDDDGGISVLIPYRNGYALAAYYCGVFSLIPCLGNLLGPTAIVLGILGLRHAQANPRAKGKGHSYAGIVLGSLTALAYWGMVIAIFGFGFLGSRR